MFAIPTTTPFELNCEFDEKKAGTAERDVTLDVSTVFANRVHDRVDLKTNCDDGSRCAREKSTV